MTNEERPAWRSRIVGHGEEDPAKLAPNPRNWRKHPRRQRAALEEVLDRVGWVQDVVVNRRTGHLVDGHLRANAAAARGEQLIPVVYVDLSIDEERLVLAALDPLAGLARTDADQLRELLGDVDLGEGALASMFGKQTAAPLSPADPDALPPPPALEVKLGEVYELGVHLLMCGDAASSADVALVTGGSRAALMFCDVLAGDVIETAQSVALEPDARIYVVGGLVPTPPDWRTLAWVHDEPLDSARRTYRRQWTPIHFRRADGGPAAAPWYGGTRQSDVWTFPREGEQLPAGQIPVELVERAYLCSTAPGARVYLPYAGDGTAIIAAERSQRVAFALELDPLRAAMAIERWQAFTGREAKRVGGRGE